MDTTVTLTEEEYTAATDVGLKRQALYKARGRTNGLKAGEGRGSACNALGATAEFALASLLGPDVLADWWDTKAYSENHWDIPCDVGKNIHVRATTYATGGLILHPYDPGFGVFVLAIQSNRTFTFAGWVYGYVGKDCYHWRCTGPGFGRPGCAAYCVQQRFLRPMDTLPTECIR